MIEDTDVVTKKIGAKELQDLIRNRIVREVYSSGQRLTEREIAEEFGVSRSVIRQAFMLLAERRLLTREENVGVTVVRIGPQEIRQLYELRGAVEGLAARLAAERAPDGAWDELQLRFGSAADQMLEAHDMDGYLELIDDTYQKIVAYTHNPVLQESMALISDRLAVLARRSVFLPGRAAQGLTLHRALIDAMVRRDGDAAERIKRANLQGACETLIKFADYVR